MLTVNSYLCGYILQAFIRFVPLTETVPLFNRRPFILRISLHKSSPAFTDKRRPPRRESYHDENVEGYQASVRPHFDGCEIRSGQCFPMRLLLLGFVRSFSFLRLVFEVAGDNDAVECRAILAHPDAEGMYSGLFDLETPVSVTHPL